MTLIHEFLIQIFQINFALCFHKKENVVHIYPNFVGLVLYYFFLLENKTTILKEIIENIYKL